jgi:hypothetical protein
VAQNANAPTLVGKPLHDLSQAPARDPPADPVRRKRSRLVPFTRFLMIFVAGIVATLAWQSWAGEAEQAIRGAAREAMCPKASPVAQDTPDRTSLPLPLPGRPAPSVH